MLTGATGFLGMELLARFLEADGQRVFALVRAGDQSEADCRLGAVMENLYGSRGAHRGRWRAIPGDIAAPGLGIESERRPELAAEVTAIVHSAATVSFTLSLEESRRCNVLGTRRMLEFADLCRRRGGLRRFAHVSTAYVAGDHRGTFAEDQLEVGQGFRNSYERSKFEAERLVREHADRLPVQIFRPSIIVGEQDSGWTASFNVLYPPLRGLETGALPLLPGRHSTPVDIVPVDYVADAIVELSRQPCEGGEVHHLVAGPSATTIGRLAERAGRLLKRRPPRLVSPGFYRRAIHPLILAFSRGRRRRALRRTEALFPYFGMRVRFDARRAHSRLLRAGIRAPSPERYLDRLLEFALAARWGKRPLSRAQARAAMQAP